MLLIFPLIATVVVGLAVLVVMVRAATSAAGRVRVGEGAAQPRFAKLMWLCCTTQRYRRYA